MCSFYFLKVILVAVESFFIGSNAQNIIFRNEDDIDFMESNSIQSPRIPESLLIQLKDIHNVSDFINRFVTTNLSSPFSTSSTSSIGGRNALAGAPRPTPSFAQPAACQPEDQIVELEKPERSDVMYWPSCVRVRRCGGCCTSKMLSCNPVATSTISIAVLQVRYNPLSPHAFEDQGSHTFTLEQHDRCACGCREQPSDCTPELHEYRVNECKCVCRNQEESSTCTGPKKIWDNQECMCKCRRVQLCSTGRLYNIQKCKCEVLRSTLNAPSLDRNNITSNATVH
ncbi:platelet-derived growth factor subunit A [Parasteatoda tepidariorum]|uniref:platelet-derived growth factor subunit A n=1 Tax=Parasteatoda tepidariorum TaxID=114398 RepID=UPI00077FA7DF|nr:platelet-derived growth factor subunit A [Parasteatoda tepidariorum]